MKEGWKRRETWVIRVAGVVDEDEGRKRLVGFEDGFGRLREGRLLGRRPFWRVLSRGG